MFKVTVQLWQIDEVGRDARLFSESSIPFQEQEEALSAYRRAIAQTALQMPAVPKPLDVMALLTSGINRCPSQLYHDADDKTPARCVLMASPSHTLHRSSDGEEWGG